MWQVIPELKQHLVAAPALWCLSPRPPCEYVNMLRQARSSILCSAEKRKIGQLQTFFSLQRKSSSTADGIMKKAVYVLFFSGKHRDTVEQGHSRHTSEREIQHRERKHRERSVGRQKSCRSNKDTHLHAHNEKTER